MAASTSKTPGDAVGSGAVIDTLSDLDAIDLASVGERREPNVVLMATPRYFAVVDVKNAFMRANVGTVDIEVARAQWTALREALEATGRSVVVIEGAPDCEDMVFAANQALPGLDAQGRPFAVLSRMRHASRQREVPYFRAFFAGRGYQVLELPEDAGYFEGQGDAIWVPGRRLLLGGYGQRTSRHAHAALAELLGVPVVRLELVHPSFYHLDTCLCPLAPSAALVFAGAFTADGMALLGRLFPTLIEVGEGEASEQLACNALALDDGRVVMQGGARSAGAALTAAGFEPVEVETSEFIKSGGSVFCMKMMIY